MFVPAGEGDGSTGQHGAARVICGITSSLVRDFTVLRHVLHSSMNDSSTANLLVPVITNEPPLLPALEPYYIAW